MPEPTSPLVSIVIPNWNGARILPRCLDAVAAQTFRDYEVIVVDNASTDQSTSGVEDCWPGTSVIRLEKNIGFAAASNLAARRARGRWLALLNNDAFPAPEWLEKLLEAAECHPDCASFAARLLQAGQPDRIYATGDIYHASGLAWHRDRNLPAAQAQSSADEVFSACAAAVLYDRAAFLEAGGFDEAYFSHHEDVDLGFRLRLGGRGCLYVPDAVVYHIGSASFGLESDRAVYQMHRNFVWTYLKDTPGALFWRYLPAHLLANLVFVVYYTLRGQGRAILKAKIDALGGLPEMMRKRNQIQSKLNPAVTTDSIRSLIDRSWFNPYLLGKRGDRFRLWLFEVFRGIRRGDGHPHA